MVSKRTRNDCAEDDRFDEQYYDRFYRNPRTRVHTHVEIETLGRFVFGYLDVIGIQTSRVVDLGCGLGFWRDVTAIHAPDASYTGVEISQYACEEMGWTHSSAADFRDPDDEGFDLVICQGVLQYLKRGECADAIANMAELCRGAIYLEALTKADWEQNCDTGRTDGDVHLRTGRWYRNQLRDAGLIAAGGGIFVPADGPAVLYELERLA